MARVTLTGADGFEFDAYHAEPADARRGGLVVLHALWGVTPHIRELCDSYAADGYEVLAPSLFDRFERGFVDANVDPPRQGEREAWADALGWGDGCMGDVQAAVDALAARGSVFVMGFCFGGTTTWLAAARCEGIAAAACFYGGQIVRYKDETPRCPTILHFGKLDPLIPPEDVEAITTAHPDIPAYLYDAGHAFVAPNAYHADSARLARLRTLQLFARGKGRGEA
jgi:carboxymethylenebutenolidase